MDSFQHFVPLAELTLVGGKLCFLEESQTVCYWSCDLGEADPRVYQT